LQYKDITSDIDLPKKDPFRKNIFIFHAGSTVDPLFRRCLLDSGSQGNLITKRALEGIRCEIKKDAGRKVRGLRLRKLLLKEFVTLELRIWGQSETFEVEFRVLPTGGLLGLGLGPAFDCLLGSEWMHAHAGAWVPAVLAGASERGIG
jgi:hypothetical protein